MKRAGWLFLFFIPAIVFPAESEEQKQLVVDVCYPGVVSKNMPRVCDSYTINEEDLVFFSVDDVEATFSKITKYGQTITQHVSNPVLRLLADQAVAAAAAAGYGPWLALGNGILSLQAKPSEDPIAKAVKVILQRIDESETRIIARIDDQFKEDALNKIEGVSTLYQIYNSDLGIPYRATSLNKYRLGIIDGQLDTLIAYMEGGRFSKNRVKNYQAYMQLVALRLLVLAEVARMNMYELYGDAMELHYAEYSSELKRQYAIVLDGVFDYINNVIASSDEWITENNSRFGPIKSYTISPKTYYATKKPELYQSEVNFYDGYDLIQKKNKNGLFYEKVVRGEEGLCLVSSTYTFEGIPYSIHTSSYFAGLGSESSRYSAKFNALTFPDLYFFMYTHKFRVSSDSNIGMDFSNYYNYEKIWSKGLKPKYTVKETEDKVLEIYNYHKIRSYYQMVEVYYGATQEILEQWWSLYHAAEDVRPKNALDIVMDNID